MRTVLLLAMVFFWARGSAEAETVAEMLTGCQLVAKAATSDGNVRLPNTPAVHLCWGAISVLQELSRWVVEGRALPLVSPCIPPDLPRTQWAAVFVAYAEKNPGRRDDEFAHVTLNAMAEEYPCRGR
jgi:hypothetical protein